MGALEKLSKAQLHSICSRIQTVSSYSLETWAYVAQPTVAHQERLPSTEKYSWGAAVQLIDAQETLFSSPT